MKTITLTDEQFDTLFEYVDNKVTTIVDASVDYQDSELLEDLRIYLMYIQYTRGILMRI